MIENEQKYLDWIIRNEVGKKDIVASSPQSYISYLKSVSKLLGETISEKNLYNEECIIIIANKLRGKRNPKTISNYKSAMRHYVRMVQEG